MAKNDGSDWTVWIALILSVIAIVMVVGGDQSITIQEGEQQDTLSVSGNAELLVDPDKADLYVRIESRDMDAMEAQEDNRIISSDVMAALEDVGVDEDEIETSDYRIERVQQYNRETGKTDFEGYKVVNVMKVVTEDLESVGEIIDAAVEAGANGIDRVEFGLSDGLMEDSRDQALEKASEMAQSKADSLADHLNVRLGSPIRISESQFDYIPFVAARDTLAMAESADGAPTTKISPQQVNVRATVSVDYRIN